MLGYIVKLILYKSLTGNTQLRLKTCNLKLNSMDKNIEIKLELK